jgi:predicted transcriptional regulator
VLAGCKVIKLKRADQEIKPVALYDQIVIDFPMLTNKGLKLVNQPSIDK